MRQDEDLLRVTEDKNRDRSSVFSFSFFFWIQSYSVLKSQYSQNHIVKSIFCLN